MQLILQLTKPTYHLYVLILILNSLWQLSDGYLKIRPQDYLCANKLIIALQKPFRGDPHFTLTEDGDSAAIITQVWNSTLSHGPFNDRIKFDCEFNVQTQPKPPRGIYTVITKLKFRRNPKTGSCIDYIRFSGGNRPQTEEICNDISKDGPGGRLIFDQRHGTVNVHLHIDKRYAIHEPLELNMVLTAHSECKYTGDFLCEPNNPYSCISRHFVRDNITNCMYPCKDEISCFQGVITTEEIDTTNVAISAITSLIFTMVGVGFCVWICWKYWNCITVQQHAHEESAARRRAAQAMPTAPSDDDFTTVGTSQHESEAQTPKDLPPSYESLFPDR